MPTTCYAILVVAAPPAIGTDTLLSWLADEIDSYPTELPGQARAPELRAADDSPDAGVPEHIRVRFHVPTSVERTTVADALETLLQTARLDWHAIRTHDCVHDLDTSTATVDGGCGAFTIATNGAGDSATTGTVPEGV